MLKNERLAAQFTLGVRQVFLEEIDGDPGRFLIKRTSSSRGSLLAGLGQRLKLSKVQTR